jgi:hypothetical protein
MRNKHLKQIVFYFLRYNKKLTLTIIAILGILFVLIDGVDDQKSIQLYLEKVQSLSEHRIDNKQKYLVTCYYLQNKNRHPNKEARHKIRNEFNSKKHKLKQEWCYKYKIKWPQEVNITYGNNTQKKALRDYEAHHLIPVNAGGINMVWNITPLSSKNHHLLHESLEEKACFSHDILHQRFMRFILQIETVFLYYFGHYINNKGTNYAAKLR